MRIGILSIQHESNTRIARRTTLDDFRRDRFQTDQQMWSQLNAHNEIGGFLAELGPAEAVPLLMAMALPGGPLADDAADALVELALAKLKSIPDLDGLLLAPHGAAVSETHEDFDGYWMSVIRAHFDRRLPIVCTVDPHANLSPAMVAATDAIFAYRTNPHLDQRNCGIEAARLVRRLAAGTTYAVMEAVFSEISINMEAQHTEEQPLRGMLDWFAQVRKRPGVLTADLVFGFPYANVRHRGAAAVIVTDSNRALAQSLAADANALIQSHRQALSGHQITIDQAMQLVINSPKPVCLLDMGDNVGGGASGDTTALAHAILQQAPRLSAFVCLYDPQVVEAFWSLPPGTQREAAVGAKSDVRFGPPIVGKFTLRCRHDGQFTDTSPRHGGRSHYDMGRVVILQLGALTLQVTDQRVAPFSPVQLTHCGINPRDFDIVIAKGVHAPVAAYRDTCPTLIRVNTPGFTANQ